MPAISPLPLDALPAELREQIAGRVAGRTLSSTLPVQIWARRPDAATAWVRLLATLNEGALLDERIREMVRLRIAAFTQCRTCQTGRKSDTVTEDEIACLSPDDERFSPRERAALRYADLFCGDWVAVGDDTYLGLAEYFSVEEVVELQMFSAMMLAGGRLAFVQRAWVNDVAPPVLGDETP